jgi:hypothetical protein
LKTWVAEGDKSIYGFLEMKRGVLFWRGKQSMDFWNGKGCMGFWNRKGYMGFWRGIGSSLIIIFKIYFSCLGIFLHI